MASVKLKTSCKGPEVQTRQCHTSESDGSRVRATPRMASIVIRCLSHTHTHLLKVTSWEVETAVNMTLDELAYVRPVFDVLLPLLDNTPKHTFSSGLGCTSSAAEPNGIRIYLALA